MLSRSAFSPRLVARAGDVWRAMQDVVADHSDSVGWPPERYVETGTLFIVRRMTVVHAREVRFGEPVVGRTWPSRERRQMLFGREVRLVAGDDTPLASATQEWVYASRALVPQRAGPEILNAYVVSEGFPSVALPEAAPLEGALHRFAFQTWHTWMDTQQHVNHPAYVDFCDEALAVMVAKAGFDPQQLMPVAETVHFRAALTAGTQVEVESRVTGHVDDAVVVEHRLLANGSEAATATTIRKLINAPQAWARTLGAR